MLLSALILENFIGYLFIIAIVTTTVCGILYLSYKNERKNNSNYGAANSIVVKTYLLNKEIKHFGYSYDPIQDILISTKDSWVMNQTYSNIVDEQLSDHSIITDCEPVCFEYNYKKWIIEFRKGQYHLNTGAEICLYNCPLDSDDYKFVTQNDYILMSFSLLKDNKLLFKRNDMHCCLSGFIPGEYSTRHQLSMIISLNFPNSDMAKAFIHGLIQCGYQEGEFKRSKHKVYLTFATPHSMQPASQTQVTEHIINKSNQIWCNIYHETTSDYVYIQDKIQHLRESSPILYQKLIYSGITPSLFQPKN